MQRAKTKKSKELKRRTNSEPNPYLNKGSRLVHSSLWYWIVIFCKVKNVSEEGCENKRSLLIVLYFISVIWWDLSVDKLWKHVKSILLPHEQRLGSYSLVSWLIMLFLYICMYINLYVIFHYFPHFLSSFVFVWFPIDRYIDRCDIFKCFVWPNTWTYAVFKNTWQEKQEILLFDIREYLYSYLLLQMCRHCSSCLYDPLCPLWVAENVIFTEENR